MLRINRGCLKNPNNRADSATMCSKAVSSLRKRKRAFLTLFLVPLLACAQERPNFLVIVADDVGYAELGPYGSEIETPALDAIAAEGLRFTSFYAQMNCSPSRAMLLSGTDSHLAGLGTIAANFVSPSQRGVPGYEGVLNNRVVTFAKLLQDNGYRSYMTGKWHLGVSPDTLPIARGFDRSFIQSAGGPANSHFNLNGPRPDATGAYFEDEIDMTGTPVADDFFSSNFYTDKLIQYMREDERQEAPFLAYLAFSAPHIPVQAPETHIDLYRDAYGDGYDILRERRLAKMIELGLLPEETELSRRPITVTPWDALSAEAKRLQARRMEIYAGAIDNMDDNIARVIDYLKGIAEYDNTVILFLSDNGAAGFFGWSEGAAGVAQVARADNSLENLGRDGSRMFYGPGWGSAGSTPFSLFKRHPAEGGIRVPAIIKVPGAEHAGEISHTTLMVSDVAPTFLELAGLDQPLGTYQGREVLRQTGKSFTAVIDNPTAVVHDEEEVLGIELWGRIAVRKGPWKLMRIEPPFLEDRWYLYNIDADPRESTDLSEQMPDKLAEMITAWERYREANNVILTDTLPAPIRPLIRPMWLIDDTPHPDPMP